MKKQYNVKLPEQFLYFNPANIKIENAIEWKNDNLATNITDAFRLLKYNNTQSPQLPTQQLEVENDSDMELDFDANNVIHIYTSGSAKNKDTGCEKM